MASPETADAIPWLALDAAGQVQAVVHAPDALAASRLIPRGTSLYVGGPSPGHPGRPWWTDNWPPDGGAPGVEREDAGVGTGAGHTPVLHAPG